MLCMDKLSVFFSVFFYKKVQRSVKEDDGASVTPTERGNLFI